jgi:hypothetical protein
VSITVHMKAVDVSPIENVVNDSLVGVVYDSPIGVVDDSRARAAPRITLTKLMSFVESS